MHPPIKFIFENPEIIYENEKKSTGFKFIRSKNNLTRRQLSWNWYAQLQGPAPNPETSKNIIVC